MATTHTIPARQDKRASRHAARSVLWRESDLRRVRHCGLYPVDVRDGRRRRVDPVVTVFASGQGDDRRAGVGGVQTCGSVWACPVCSEKINTRRGVEVAAAVKGWRWAGGDVAMLTLTMRHRKGRSLKSLWDALSKAWRAVVSGRGWKRDQVSHSVSGWLRAVEVTHGRNGWHVHVHALLFLDGSVLGRPTVESLEALLGSVYGRWAGKLASLGFTTARQGVDIRLATGDDDDLGKYLTKQGYAVDAEGLGWEVTAGHGKDGRGGNRTPFRVLGDVVQLGDADDLDVWHEFERASKGRRQLTWSRGLRDLVRLGVEQTDEEIAAEAMEGEPVARLEPEAWRAVALAGLVPYLLELAERDDGGGCLRATLAEWGVQRE